MNKFSSKFNRVWAGILLVVGAFVSGCRPYDTPEFKTKEANQTAFVIPLDDVKDKQEQSFSEDFLRKNKVNVARIPIPHVWIQTGRQSITGYYAPTVKVILVDLAPEAREWEDIRAETKESTAFRTTMTMNAVIRESDAAKFVSSFRGSTLDDVLDTKIQRYVKGRFAEECSKYTMDELLVSKSKIVKVVHKDTIAFAATQGITIDALNLAGTFVWENPDIQRAFDEKVKSRQEQEVQLAKARATKEAAKAQAEAAQLMASSNSKFSDYTIRMKQLELEEKRIAVWKEKWNGQVPQIVTSNQAGLWSPGSLTGK